MFNQVLNSFLGACRVHPAMAVFILALACTGVLYANEHYAQRSDFFRVESRVVALELRVERANLESAIRSLQFEIYSFERLVSKGEAIDRDEERLAELRVELDQKLRELKRLELRAVE